MTDRITTTIPGEPVPMPRARTVTKGSHVMTYTPAKARTEIERIRYWWLANGPGLVKGPIMVYMTFLLTKPKTVQRYWPSVRPDLDNYIKLLLDALNGLAWQDDGAICNISASKQYALDDPGYAITIEQMYEHEKGERG